MANYYGTNSNGRTLMHYRTKGSRNGYSKDPNYRPVGQQAQGKIINGRYVYDTPNTISGRGLANGIQSMQKGYKNNWQQQGNYARAGGEAINRAVAGQTRGVRMKINSAQENQAIAGMTAKARRDLSKAGAKNNWQQQGNATAARGMTNNRVNSGASKYQYSSQSPLQHPGTKEMHNLKMLQKNGAKYDSMAKGNAGNDYWKYERASAKAALGSNYYAGKPTTGLNMNSVHNAQTERERHEALESTVNGIKGGIIKNRDQVARGFAKNIQDRIRTANPYGEQKNVGGAMRNDPRYSSNSVVGTVSGNMNKQELAAVGSAVKGAYNKIAHPIDRQVNKIKGTAAKATREVKKTASNVVNKGKATVNNLLKKFKKKK